MLNKCQLALHWNWQYCLSTIKITLIKIWNYTNYQYIWFLNLLFEKGSHRYYLPQPNNQTKCCRNFFVVGVIEILVTFLGERKEETAIASKDVGVRQGLTLLSQNCRELFGLLKNSQHYWLSELTATMLIAIWHR